MKVHIIFFILLNFLGFNYAEVGSRSGFSFPRPSGPYAVGSQYFYLIDKTRPDTYTSDPGDHREISMQVWYPAEPKPNELPMNYSKKESAEHEVNLGYFIPSVVDEVALRPSYSYLKAAVAKEKDSYPVILFSTSGKFYFGQRTGQVQNHPGHPGYQSTPDRWCDQRSMLDIPSACIWILPIRSKKWSKGLGRNPGLGCL